MTNIKNAMNQPWAIMKDDRTVWNLKNVKLGHVEENGEVWDVDSKVGYFRDDNGYIYEGADHVGTVRSDGKVVDIQNHVVGEVEGSHMMLAGAALMLLVR